MEGGDGWREGIEGGRGGRMDGGRGWMEGRDGWREGIEGGREGGG